MELSLPWPPAKLSPNGSHGSHWAWAKAGKKYRDDCLIWLRFQRVPLVAIVSGPIMLEMTFCPPTRRLSDLDNLLARSKHGIDALAQLMGVDDKVFEFTLRRGDPVKHGSVKVAVRAA